MRASIRLFLLAFLVLVGFTAQAQSLRWSDPATWPNNQVPAAGDKVTIASGQEVLLDVSPPALDGITINGKLVFADESDLSLTTEWILVLGELQIGTEANPPSSGWQSRSSWPRGIAMSSARSPRCSPSAAERSSTARPGD